MGRGEGRNWCRMAALACPLGMLLAGCSISLPIGAMLGSEEVPTGSTAPALHSPLSPELTAEDWRRAKSALAVALDPVGNGSSVAWENPETGLKGSFVPVGQPFVSSDEICRAFIADLTLQSGSDKLQGSACRPSGGEWVVKDVKPWKKRA